MADQGSWLVDSRIIPYSCKLCGKHVKEAGYKPAYTHAQHVIDCLSKYVEGVDYVQCRLCDFVAARLVQHIENEHGVTKAEYVARFNCAVMPSKVRDKYSACNKHNGGWISRCIAAGDDLTDYRAKMGAAVSDSIMSDPDERKRRSELCSAVLTPIAQSTEGRERSRIVATKTSARPEIQASRTLALKKWRTEHFEEFYEKCLSKMHGCWYSKPERKLFQIVHEFASSFKRNQRFSATKIAELAKSKRKQVDILSEDLSLIVEFDGPHHFKPIRGPELLTQVQKLDAALDLGVIERKWTLIRVGYDQFKYRKKDDGFFMKPCLEALFKLIMEPTPGVHCLGAAYGDRNLLEQEMPDAV